VFVVHGGMVALLRPPTVEQRFDTRGSPWTTDELASSVGGYFADRDPDRIFAATEILSLP
jgi:3-oxoacyl-[acyl-carrier protein] reductase